MHLRELEARLGYVFKDEKHLETALTHPSFGGDHHVPHYQRLEFLGDAVLELAVSRYLYFELPDVDEGKLTRIRAYLVREETLSRAAQRLGLGEFIRFSVGEDKVTADARLIDDLGADSANLMMLIMDLETEYDMTVEDEALTTIKTVGDIVSYIEAHKA